MEGESWGGRIVEYCGGETGFGDVEEVSDGVEEVWDDVAGTYIRAGFGARGAAVD